MARRRKLGRLVVGSPEPPTRRPHWWWGLAALIVVLALVIWPPPGLRALFVPCRIVVRGCVLTDAPGIMGRLSAPGDDTYLQLWRQARSLELGEERWLQGVAVKPAWGRTAVVTVNERHPLLRVVAGVSKYWLCDDSELVAMDVENDFGGVFDSIRRLPSVNLPRDPGCGPLPQGQQLLVTGACLEEVLSGVIDVIEVEQNGELTLYDYSGFPIRLGTPENLRRKIGALEKAWRSCADDRQGLRYLDASELPVFYEKWKQPQQ